MKNPDAVHLRYIDTDDTRTFVLQRADGLVWNGGGWSKAMHEAHIFFRYDHAVAAYAALMYARHRGKPMRTFKLEMTLTLVADNVEQISPEAFARYVSNAVRVQTENTEHGDGPVPGSYVQARLKLKTLKETPTRKKTF